MDGAVDPAELLDEPPRADETGPAWDQAEATRFGRYARRLWEELLSVETLEHH